MTEENPNSDNIGDVRKQLVAALAENKSLKTEVRSYKVGEALKSFNVTNPKIKNLIPSDLDVSDTDAIKQWIDDNSDVYNFGFVNPETAVELSAPVSEPGEPVDVAVNRESNAQKSMKQLNQASQNANPNLSGADKLEGVNGADAAAISRRLAELARGAN